nr:hypothetical protein [Bacillus safensis]
MSAPHQPLTEFEVVLCEALAVAQEAVGKRIQSSPAYLTPAAIQNLAEMEALYLLERSLVMQAHFPSAGLRGFISEALARQVVRKVRAEWTPASERAHAQHSDMPVLS